MSLLSLMGLGPRPATPAPAPTPSPPIPPVAQSPATPAAAKPEAGADPGQTGGDRPGEGQGGVISYEPQPAPVPSPVYSVEAAAPPIVPLRVPAAVREIGVATFDSVRLQTTPLAMNPTPAAPVTAQSTTLPLEDARSIYTRSIYLLLAGQATSASARIVSDL